MRYRTRSTVIDPVVCVLCSACACRVWRWLNIWKGGNQPSTKLIESNLFWRMSMTEILFERKIDSIHFVTITNSELIIIRPNIQPIWRMPSFKNNNLIPFGVVGRDSVAHRIRTSNCHTHSNEQQLPLDSCGCVLFIVERHRSLFLTDQRLMTFECLFVLIDMCGVGRWRGWRFSRDSRTDEHNRHVNLWIWKMPWTTYVYLSLNWSASKWSTYACTLHILRRF